MTGIRKPAHPDDLHDVVAFLYLEARLLDDGRYREWLAMLTDDVHYLMPAVENRYRRDEAPPAFRMNLFDDRMSDLVRRVDRFESDVAWPEDPPTRHLHLVSNIEAFATDAGFEVHSAFVNHRSRGDHDDMVFFGRREDELVRVDGELRLRRRLVRSSQSLLAARNLNTFL